MITIEGKPRHPGVAIAVAAVVDAASGINAVAPGVLQDGVHALKRNLSAQDYPEAVIACDNLALGYSARIPGVTASGIAAQADVDIPGLPVEVPCVIGLPNLLRSISDGDILIVDGTRGVIFVNPDPDTLVHYQRFDEHREAAHTVFLASEHIPARTQTGETVYVHAYIETMDELERAIEEGADGLVVDLRGSSDHSVEIYRDVLQAAPGKPVAFAVDFVDDELTRSAALFGSPCRLTLLLPASRFGKLAAEYKEAAEAVARDLANAEMPEIAFGAMSRDSEYDPDKAPLASRLLIDPRDSLALADYDEAELGLRVSYWIGTRGADDVLLLIRDGLEVLASLVRVGVRSVCVASEKVARTKCAIRALGEEDLS